MLVSAPSPVATVVQLRSHVAQVHAVASACTHGVRGVGASVGAAVGDNVGAAVGDAVGDALGDAEGAPVGLADGVAVGLADGAAVGANVKLQWAAAHV